MNGRKLQIKFKGYTAPSWSLFWVQTSNEKQWKKSEKGSGVEGKLHIPLETKTNILTPPLTWSNEKLIQQNLKNAFHECTFFHRKYICVIFYNIFTAEKKRIFI